MAPWSWNITQACFSKRLQTPRIALDTTVGITGVTGASRDLFSKWGPPTNDFTWWSFLKNVFRGFLISRNTSRCKVFQGFFFCNPSIRSGDTSSIMPGSQNRQCSRKASWWLRNERTQCFEFSSTLWKGCICPACETAASMWPDFGICDHSAWSKGRTL